MRKTQSCDFLSLSFILHTLRKTHKGRYMFLYWIKSPIYSFVFYWIHGVSCIL